LDFAGQVAEDDLLPTRLPDKVKKPRWAKPRKSHGKASARSFTGAEAAEITANQAEQSNKIASTPQENTPGNDDDEIIVPATPPRPAGQPQVAGESQGGTTITLAVRTPDRLRPGPDLCPRASSAPETEPEWQLPASTAPPSLGQVEAGLKRKRKATIRYQKGREDGYTASVGLSQPRA
jgi:hypothetical protein